MKTSGKNLAVIVIILLIALLSLFLLFGKDIFYEQVRRTPDSFGEKLTFVTEDYPPLTYKDGNGEVAGIVTDIVREIMENQSIDEKINLLPWADAYETALNNNNVVIFSIRRTDAREDLFNWIGPIAKSQTIFYAKKGSGITLESLEDAKKLDNIGIVNEWFSAQNLKNDGFENLVSSPFPTDVVEKLINEEIDVAPFVDITVEELVEEAGYTMNDIEPVFIIDEGFNYIGISKGTSEKIVQEWQKDFDQIRANEISDAKQQAEDLTNSAVLLIETDGEKAFEQFRKKGSEWYQDDSYVFVWTMEGIRVCYPPDISREGDDTSDLVDYNGKKQENYLSRLR